MPEPRKRRQVDFGAGVLDRADKESAGHGKWILGGLSVLSFVGAYLVYSAAGSEASGVVSIGVGFQLGLGAVFGVLAVLAGKRPLMAMTVGLGVYCALQLLGAILEPSTITSGLFVKVAVIGGLLGGISVQRALQKR